MPTLLLYIMLLYRLAVLERRSDARLDEERKVDGRNGSEGDDRVAASVDTLERYACSESTLKKAEKAKCLPFPTSQSRCRMPLKV